MPLRLRVSFSFCCQVSQSGVCSGRLRCWIVQVQIRRVKRELHRISNVPRTFVDETKFTTSDGRVQLGWKVLDAVADRTRRIASNDGHMLLTSRWVMTERKDLDPRALKLINRIKISLEAWCQYSNSAGRDTTGSETFSCGTWVALCATVGDQDRSDIAEFPPWFTSPSEDFSCPFDLRALKPRSKRAIIVLKLRDDAMMREVNHLCTASIYFYPCFHCFHYAFKSVIYLSHLYTVPYVLDRGSKCHAHWEVLVTNTWLARDLWLRQSGQDWQKNTGYMDFR